MVPDPAKEDSRAQSALPTERLRIGVAAPGSPSRRIRLLAFPPVAEKGRYPTHKQLPFVRQTHHEYVADEIDTNQ